MLSSSVAKVTRRYWESSWGEGERSFKHSKRTCQCSKWDSVTATSSGKGSVRTGHRHFCVARWAANGASGTRAVAERCLGLRERNHQPASQLRVQVSAVRGSAQARGHSLERYVSEGMAQRSIPLSLLPAASSHRCCLLFRSSHLLCV